MRHRIPVRLAALACALASLAACAGGPRASSSVPRLDAVAWDSTTPPDSIAGWIGRECARGAADARRTCVERSLYGALDRAGIAAAMGALDRLVEAYPWTLPDAHSYAHGLGIAAYRSPETVGRTFAACTPSQSSGCYHGVIQGYFLAMKREHGGLSAAQLNALCEEHRARSFLFFQCTHGLGHGVMALSEHDLPRALEMCDGVTEAYVRDACYGGAFMENVVAFTHPHNTAEAHSEVVAAAGEHAGHAGMDHGGGAHAGHAMAGMDHGQHGGAHEGHGPAAGTAWKALDPRDLHHPCTAVGERYRLACYDNQAPAMLTLAGGDVDRVARECAAAPPPAANARACFQSLGRNVLPRVRWDAARSMELCARAPEPGRGWCGLGVATTMTNRSADARDGLRVCALMAAGEVKTECYRTLGWMLTSTERDPARREEACAAVDPAFAATCREGAGLTRREE